MNLIEKEIVSQHSENKVDNSNADFEEEKSEFKKQLWNWSKDSKESFQKYHSNQIWKKFKRTKMNRSVSEIWEWFTNK